MTPMRRTVPAGPCGPGGLGVPAGPELVRSIMHDLGLMPCQPPAVAGQPHRGRRQEHGIPDLVHRDFTAAAPGERDGRPTLRMLRRGKDALPGDGHRLPYEEVIGWAAMMVQDALIEKAIRDSRPRSSARGGAPLRSRRRLHVPAVRLGAG